MNAYKLTVRTESKNKDTGETSLTNETEHYFGEYTNASKFAVEKFGEMETFGDVNEAGELRVGKFADSVFVSVFEPSKLVYRTVINITRIKVN
jgi:hypothetical protein